MQHEARNLSMVMDLYELTMANGYFAYRNGQERVAFDVFYRRNPDQGGFAIFAGLAPILDYLEQLHFTPTDIDYLRSLHMFDESFLQYLAGFRFRGDVYAMPEGTIIYPNEPVITIVAPLIDAQLIETTVLTMMNHQSLIATKANRIVRAAEGRLVSDFGARRAHNVDAAVYGARAAYIGGVDCTATVLAGQQFGIPVSGTMAHSWVMYHASEYEAFANYAKLYPDSTVLLVDTYDVLESGIPNAIRTAKEILEPQGQRLVGIRLDSGDLAYLSKKARHMLDAAGLLDCKIMVSNSLDEYTITSLLQQGAPIDGFGVGERLITAKSDPVFGAVYKIVGIKSSEEAPWQPRIKISEAVEKITNPGLKKVYRIYNDKGEAKADLIAGYNEVVDVHNQYEFIDPERPWLKKNFHHCEAKELQQWVMQDGKRVVNTPSLEDIRQYVQQQLEHEIWVEEQRFENPHKHYLNMSPDYYAMKMNVLAQGGHYATESKESN